MDDIVKQALAKWPNVPHCYGWLGLDARGNWRMRDERAQHLGLPGDKLSNAALVGFIVRNYASDERGCWYFQNGPQRVYLNLETTPFVARTDPAQGFVLHTGEALGQPEAAYLTEAGELLLQRGAVIAQLDDRDVAQAMTLLEIDGRAMDDEALMAWLEGGKGALTLRSGDGGAIGVQRVRSDGIPAQFGFIRQPQPDAPA
ncbi:DUF2946 family protein [Pseudoduganella aquatica]|uniref:DUF2946 family protein n=1 Tax=Pseudoduganella aquatica TaxID=2660641 RepID=UPI001E5F2408|nr:DUF2946 family protein [Pseudoduganella aquatica]